MDVAPPNDRPLAPPPRLRRRSLFLCCALAALVPGLGQLYARRPVKALLMLLAIGGLFVGGLALTGFTAVNPTTHRLEFVAHLFITGPTALTLHLTEGLTVDTFQPWYDVGRLYVAVAGILNVVAAWDAMSAVFDHNEQAEALAHLGLQRQQGAPVTDGVQDLIDVQAVVDGPGMEQAHAPR